MQSGNRNVWIAIIVALVVLCCIAAVVGAILVGWLVDRAKDLDLDATDWGTGSYSERTEFTFDLGAAPYLELDSFAGNVTVRAGEGNTVRVTATKNASRESDLDAIEITWDEQEGGLRVEAKAGERLASNRWVEFDITMPAGARLDLKSGAGNVNIHDVEGELRAQTGAGNIAVRGARAPVDLDTGAGNINYEGTPQSDCTFETGAGNITLRLSEDADVEVDLDSGIGEVTVRDFEVQGSVTRGEVKGVIGAGMRGRIKASTGAGNINVSRR
jgi:DUF4097 and DUF4098 domain-containing protein YvlB